MKVLIIAGTELNQRRAWSMVRSTFFRQLGQYVVVEDFKAIGGGITINTLQVIVKSGNEYISNYNSHGAHLKARIINVVECNGTIEPLFLIENWRWGECGVQCTPAGLIEIIKESQKTWSAYVTESANKLLGVQNV